MGGYVIMKPIGSGSFGKVFMARHKATQQIVALKKISKVGSLIVTALHTQHS